MLIGKDPEAEHPEELIADISRTPLGGKLILSTVIHIVLIALTSVGFIVLCLRYGTLDPRKAMEEAKQNPKEEVAADEQGETATASSEAKAEEAETSAAEADRAEGASKESPGTSESVAGESPIEKEIKEVSTERPQFSTTDFDEIDELE